MDILKKKLQKPLSIAVVPTSYLLFWTDVGDHPTIQSSGLDGSLRKVLLSTSVIWPTGISIDIVKKRLYWMDVRMHSITSCDFDGSKLQVLNLASDSLVHPWRLSVFEDTVYWSDWAEAHSTIYSANKLRGGEVQSLAVVNMQNNPLNLRVFHKLAQPSQENICLQRKNPCSHMCLVTRDLYTKCMCPRNFVLTDENICKNPTKESNHSRSTVNYNEDARVDTILISIISSAIITTLLIILVIFLIFKKCKREEEVETALEMEKNKHVEEAESMIEETTNCSQV